MHISPAIRIEKHKEKNSHVFGDTEKSAFPLNGSIIDIDNINTSLNLINTY